MPRTVPPACRMPPTLRQLKGSKYLPPMNTPCQPSWMPTTSMPLVQCAARHCADDRVHARGIAAAGNDADAHFDLQDHMESVQG